MVGADRIELSNACVSDMCVFRLHHAPINKMHAINAIYWIRTNVSSVAASALTTKLNARMVDTNVTLLYASSNSTRSKWPNHYDSLLYQIELSPAIAGEWDLNP